jgi:DnaJ-class molecular chaperone
MITVLFRVLYYFVLVFSKLYSSFAFFKTRNHYETLDLPKDCTIQQIKKAYRQLALELHPDKVRNSVRFSNLDPTDAKIMFLEVQNAYAVLSSADRRFQYDLQLSGVEYEPYAEQEADNRYMTSNRDFQMYIQTPMYRLYFATRYPKNEIPILQVTMKVSFKDTLLGIKNRKQNFHRKELCDVCKGTGSKNGAVVTCKFCNGVGMAPHLLTHPNGRFRQMTHTVCAMCSGRGFQPREKCEACNGKGMRVGESFFHIDLSPGFRSGLNVVIRNAGHMNRDAQIGDVRTTVQLELPKEWEVVSESGGLDVLLCTMRTKLLDILSGFSKLLYLPSGEALDIDWAPVPIPGVSKIENVDVRDNSDALSMKRVVDVNHLVHGIYIDRQGFGISDHTGARGILRIKIVCDFSSMDAVATFSILEHYGIIESYQTATNSTLDNAGDILGYLTRRRKAQLDMHILLQHLISMQPPGQDDLSLTRLMNMYSAMLMNEDDLPEQNEASEEETVSLDEFDFRLGKSDIQFDS